MREDAGRVELTIRLHGPRVPELGYPVIFTYFTEDGNATSKLISNRQNVLNLVQLLSLPVFFKLLTDGDDYRSRPGPQIGTLTREREQSTGDRRVLSFGIVDDDVAERPETFSVRLRTSETGVSIRRGFGEATVIIMDNDGGMSTNHAAGQFVHQ